MNFTETLSIATAWTNDNPGPLRVIMLLMTIIFGWVSGIFSALMRKPKFQITYTAGPTFCCTYLIGKKHGEYDVHRTGIALYLRIANIGSAPSSIENILVGYHWHLNPFSYLWLKNSIGWFWLKEQAVALEDFQTKIGEGIKVYPFLIQKSFLSGSSSETYLEVGRSTNGVVYFEQDDSYGGCFPAVRKNKTVCVKVQAKDTFGRTHSATFYIPSITLEEAQEYNPSFGKTYAELRGEPLPCDNDSASNSQ